MHAMVASSSPVPQTAGWLAYTHTDVDTSRAKKHSHVCRCMANVCTCKDKLGMEAMPRCLPAASAAKRSHASETTEGPCCPVSRESRPSRKASRGSGRRAAARHGRRFERFYSSGDGAIGCAADAGVSMSTWL